MNEPRSSKVLHWKLAIQEYDCKTIHIEGRKNVVADCFSRLLSAADMDGLRSEQNADKHLCTIVQTIPEEKYELIKLVHNALVGHRGVERTVSYLRAQGHSWPHMKDHVRTFIRLCPCCQKMDVAKRQTTTQLYNLSARAPHELINIDTLEINQVDECGYSHIIVVIDCFSRWVELFPVKSLTGEEAALKLIEHFSRYGPPVAIKTDNGTQFLNGIIQQVTKYFGVTHNTSIPHSHEENGIVERANKEVLRHLVAYLFDQRINQRWSWAIPMVQRIMNTTVNTLTGFTPAELLMGPAANLDRYTIDHRPLLSEASGHVPESIAGQLSMHQAIIELADSLRQEANKKHLMEQRGEPVAFEEGNYVLVDYPWSRKGQVPPNKTLTHKRGPMKIMEVNGDEYAVQDCITRDIEYVHVTRLSPFYYNPVRVDPEKIAYRDKGTFDVEAIVDHYNNGNNNTPKSLWDFKVRWTGYPPEEDRWLPWSELRNNILLHKYLFEHGFKSMIPKEHRKQSY